MKNKPIPKDLKVKIGTKKEVVWNNIKDGLEKKQLESKIEQIINTEIITLCEKEIEKEKNL